MSKGNETGVSAVADLLRNVVAGGALKLNCWEYFRCGREPAGKNVVSEGVCPAAVTKATDGSNAGKNAGRVCWIVAGTLCGGTPKGTFAKKIAPAIPADFTEKFVKKKARPSSGPRPC